eukprot:comp23997_c1_seq8/m.42705 comp23997_c1_seq8/g.42705  ORF comp23997_c1_seq8/g.42705 comp23997_c1_seq8/m.42705 type:complete len:109 (+) comp23997_c1_seq8:644-970(+)
MYLAPTRHVSLPPSVWLCTCVCTRVLDQEGFHAAWRTHFKGVSLSTETTNFVKCEYCCILKARLKLATTNAARIHIREILQDLTSLRSKNLKFSPAGPGRENSKLARS